MKLLLRILKCCVNIEMYMDNESATYRSAVFRDIIGAVASDDASKLKKILDSSVGSKFPAANLNRFGILHLAAMFSGPEIVTELIDAGADVSVIDDNGETPLDLAFRPETRRVLEVAARAQDQLKATLTPNWRTRVTSPKDPRAVE
jgi:hypothetical protein